ncbi:MAG: peptide-methionine (S)-S-oxide reductase MsrA [Rhodobacterales bacterium]|jgi:peptide-methionine (S)-S-oxide reductase|tara:strand:- start:2112 stop:2762 length:651 start_codon:yes stop_codon:yes gene_type:complete
MLGFGEKTIDMVSLETALKGRNEELITADYHFINGRPLNLKTPDGMNVAIFGMGCFWGAERIFWSLDGVYSTMVGYTSGFTLNPTYQEVCTGLTGHNEVVRIVYDPSIISYNRLLKIFWESHNPTQGMRQGNDLGTQYRSGIYYSDDTQNLVANETKLAYEKALTDSGYGKITTEILSSNLFYFAEDYHQQYLAKNPSGYCGIGGTGVTCLTGINV